MVGSKICVLISSKKQDPVKMTQTGDRYQLQFELTQPEDIKPFAKYIEENPQTNGKLLNSSVTYHSLRVSLVIHQQTFILEEVRFDLHYTYPAYMPSKVEMKEQWK